MNKRILSVLLLLVLVVSLLVTAVPVSAAPANPSVTISANSAKANPGDTVTFTVTLGPTAGLYFFTFDLVIPDGLTYVDGSINAAAATATNFGDNLEIDKHGDGTPFIQGYEADAKNYVSESSVKIATFRCTVNAKAANGAYTVRTKDEDFGNADFGVLNAKITPATLTVAPKLLATPQLSKVQNGAAGVNLAWGKVAGAAKYRVFRKAGTGSWAKLADTAAVSLVDKTAKSGTKYAYTVRCLSSDSKSYTSDYNKTGKSILYLAQPKLAKFENVAKGTKISWGKIGGAASYKVFVKVGKTWKSIANVKTNTCTYATSKSGTTFTYTIRAVDKSGKVFSSFNNKGWSKKFIGTPKLPTLKNTKNGVQITFKKVNGAEKYRIFRKVGNGKFTKLADTTKLTFVDKSAKNGKKYSYTVRCMTKNGSAYTSAYNTTGRAIVCKR